jgi:hypothetical protein
MTDAHDERPGADPINDPIDGPIEEPIDDPRLAEDLQAVVTERYGPVPDAVVAAAKGAFTWRTVDAELAELLEEETLAVRSGGATLAGPIAYAVEGLVIDVEHEGNAVLGQLSDSDGEPVWGAVVIEVAEADGGRRLFDAELDDAGAFRATVPAGQARVAITLPGGRRVVTPWLPS